MEEARPKLDLSAVNLADQAAVSDLSERSKRRSSSTAAPEADRQARRFPLRAAWARRR
jgi:hypothetical protein